MAPERNRIADGCIDKVFSIQPNAAYGYNLGGARSGVPNGAGAQIESVCLMLPLKSFQSHEVHFAIIPVKIVTIVLIT
jgi:hypothetical protein